jgi:hypothetical protein
MTTQSTEDRVAVLNVAGRLLEAKAKATGRVPTATEYSEVARLSRESLGPNGPAALEALLVLTGAPAAPAKAAAPAVNEETDLGRALIEGSGRRSPFFAEAASRTAAQITEATDLGPSLMESGRRTTARSPFFSESLARTLKEIAEDAAVPGATVGVADEIGRMALVNGDEKYHELTRAWAMSVPFGGRRLDG